MAMMLKKKSERQGHEGAIYQLQTLRSGEGFLSVGGDGWLVHWPTDANVHGQLLAKVDGGKLLCVQQLAHQGLVAGDLTGGLHWLYPQTPDDNLHLSHHTKGIFAIELIGDQLFTGGGDGYLSRWSVQDRRVLESLPLSLQSLRAIAYSAKLDLLAVGSSDQYIYFLRASTMELLQQWQAHTNSVFSLAFSSDDQYLVSGGRDAMLRVWPLPMSISGQPEGGLQAGIPAHNYTLNTLAYSPSGRYLATGSRDKTFKIWDSTDFRLLKVAETIRDKGHINSVNALCWLNDESIVTAGDDRKIIEWTLG